MCESQNCLLLAVSSGLMSLSYFAFRSCTLFLAKMSKKCSYESFCTEIALSSVRAI